MFLGCCPVLVWVIAGLFLVSFQCGLKCFVGLGFSGVGGNVCLVFVVESGQIRAALVGLGQVCLVVMGSVR